MFRSGVGVSSRFSVDNIGVYLWQTGPSMALQDWQARNGFPHIEEEDLKDFLKHKGKAIPSAANLGGDPKLELTLASINAVKPAWSLEEALKSVQLGF